MSDEIKLTDEAALNKLKELAEGIRVCMFETGPHASEIRPMSTLEVDTKGNIWFFSAAESEKNKQISFHPDVRLVYSDNTNSKYLVVDGDATIIEDRLKAAMLWTPVAKAWFPEGVDDPNLRLICVHPHKAHYWDVKYGKMIAFLQMAAAAVTGKPADVGEQGTLIIKSAGA